MKYFLFNHAGSKNHGCEALVRGTVNIIENSDKNAEFILSSNDSQADEVIDDIEIKPAKRRELSLPERIIAALDLKINKSEIYALEKMYSPIVSDAADCDICLSIGGDTYCYGDNHEIQVLTRELKKTGKKTVLWGASIGETDLTDEKLESLGDFDAIFAREPITYELLKEKNANENIYLFSDPAFCMERENVEPIEGFTRENTLGFNISPLVAKGDPKKREIAEDFISFVLENTTLKILLVPHVVEENNNDYDFMKPIYEKFAETERIAILPPTLNATQYKGYIANTRFFVVCLTSASFSAEYTIKSDELRRPLNGTGAIYGQSVSSSSLSSGTISATSSGLRAFLNVTAPPRPIYIPSFSTSFAISALPEKQCTTPFGLYLFKRFIVSSCASRS